MRLAGERGQREILQAGIELDRCAGAPTGDAEVLAVAAAALARLGLPDDPSRCRPRRAGARSCSAPRPTTTRAPRLAAAIARKDRAGVRAAARALPRERRAARRGARRRCGGPRDATLERARALPWPDDGDARARSAAARCSRRSPSSPIAGAGVTIDLGDLRGFDYYTGVRFAATRPARPMRSCAAAATTSCSRATAAPARRPGSRSTSRRSPQAQRAAGVAPPSARDRRRGPRADAARDRACAARARPARGARRSRRVRDWPALAARRRARCRGRSAIS